MVLPTAHRLAAIVCSALLASCSTTATVLTRDGRKVESRIVGGDREHLLLQSEYGVEQVVRRTEVRDIDHPGNVVALLGGLLMGGGALDLAVLGGFCAARGASAGSSCPMIFGVLGGVTAAGAGMLIWGLWTWLGSKNAVTDSLATAPSAEPVPPGDTPAPPQPVPPLAPSL